MEQRNEYKTLMGLFLAQPNCKSFFTWGVNDAQSWVPASFSGYGSALLFSNTTGTNGEYVAKSDYYGVQDALLASTGVLQAPNCVSKIIPAAEGAASNGTFDLLGRRLNPLPYNSQKFAVKPCFIHDRHLMFQISDLR
jgi:endo-1,4-beta-xylanase